MIAIPVSIISTFVVIAGLGLSINVISLAGSVFAVGMVVDVNSQFGEYLPPETIGSGNDAGRVLGARQVWAPILGSALTTVVVFVPILLLDLPIGQLFRDIAVAISVSVIVSVIISITVIPALASQFIKDAKHFDQQIRIPIIDTLASGFKRLVLAYGRKVVKSTWLGLTVVLLSLLVLWLYL